MNRVLRSSPARTSIARLVSARSLFACALVVVTGASAFAAQDPAVHYVRTGDNGAKLYNLADKTSISVATLPAKTLLEVYAEKAGYLSVDAPAGMEVWVYGEFVRPTPLTGTVEVTGANVFMRPLPKGDAATYPLEQRLHKGDRVRVIGRNDPKKPLAEDWVHIVTPPGTRAWVLASDTTPVDPKEDVQSAWNDAVKSGRAARPVFDIGSAAGVVADASKGKDATDTDKGNAGKIDTGKTGAGTTNAAATGAQDGDSFAAAEKMYDAAKNATGADWASVRAAYQRYLDKSPDGPLAAQARKRLEQVDMHAEIESIRNDRTLREAQRGDKLADAERRLREANASQDPLQGRFQARGFVVREQPVESQPARYVVYWAGKPTYELVCSNGRYDLSVFDQFEVGVQGAVLRSAVAESDTVAARPGRIDVAHIEVLSARAH